LDALFIVTDTGLPRAQPLIVKTERTEKTLHLEWNGEGAAFQVETTPALPGPWSPFSPILPDTAFDGDIHDPSEAAFFRLRQW